MNRKNYRVVCTGALALGAAIGLTVAGGSGNAASAAPTKRTAKVPSYAAVETILKRDCVSCHNDARHPEKVNLSSFDKMMASGEHGPIVVPGQPEKSNLLLYVNGAKQPRMPMRKPPLSKSDITTISDWIKAGAKH